MSNASTTTVQTLKPSTLSKASSIQLSPIKQRVLKRSLNDKNTLSSTTISPNLYSWTLTDGAVASCFISDVLEMRRDRSMSSRLGNVNVNLKVLKI